MIQTLTINYIENPIGFDVRQARIQWTLDKEESVTVQIQKENTVIYSQEVTCGNYVDIDLDLEELTKYEYTVLTSDSSKTNTFVTPKYSKWTADFITPKQEDSAIIEKQFEVNKEVKSAYISMVGLGVYEAYLNTEFVNQEYLMPGYHTYKDYLQYQTYPLNLKQGLNTLEVLLGNGWYKGRLGFDGGFYKVYGDSLALIFEIKIEYTDGTNEIICSDTTCQSKDCPYISNGIYDGETFDANIQSDKRQDISIVDLNKNLLMPRLSLPIVKHETFKPTLIVTPKNEKVLDFHQNLTGWVECKTSKDLHLYFGEILQDDCFYNENYRTAKFGYEYKGDGKERVVRPHFAFYVFRYVKVETEDEINVDDFTAYAIYSDVKQTGWIETGNKKVNQLISNALWSQKDNFLDVPTDCPQRDERLGWTGDAQAFSGTALYNMNCIPFYQKYLYDMKMEQEKYDGQVPIIVPIIAPDIKNYAGDKNKPEKAIRGYMGFMSCKSSSPWSDSATIIPWNTYMFSGNKNILKNMYPNMKMWCDFIIEHEGTLDNSPFGQHTVPEKHIPYLFDSGSHLADWLALDTVTGGPMGKTDEHYIASIYYYNTTLLVAKAAKELGYSEADFYFDHASKVRNAIRENYLADGLVNVDTQTAYVIALQFGILEESEIQKNVDQLAKKIQDNNGKLETGFTGTPYLNLVLSKYGYSNLAYDLLLNEEYPGWLHEVNMGATTIWERWNSVQDDGHMNPDGMNSLNHYAYGSIVEWMYREVGGLNTMDPGFTNVVITPKVDKRLGYAKVHYKSVAGTYKIEWNYTDTLTLKVDVPVGCRAKIVLPLSNKVINVEEGHFEFVE